MRKLLLGALRLVVLLIALHVASTFVRVAEAGGGVNIGTLRTFVQAIFNGTISITGQVAGNAIVWNGTAWVAGAAVVAAPTWQAVLVAGNTSGGTNPTISTGDSLVGQTTLTLAATGANVIDLRTNAASRLTISDTQISVVDPARLCPNGSGTRTIAIGASTVSSGDDSIAIGESANSAQNDSIALGNGATVTAANQFVTGANGNAITSLYLGGNGVTNATPTATVTWRVTSATAASGAAGTNIVIRAGEGDGAGADGTITFNTNGTANWVITGAGDLTVTTDSTINIGASAARVLGTFTDYTAHQRLLVNSSPVTLSATGEEIVEVDASGGTRTVNLPDATTTVVGRRYVIKDNGSAGTNNVTIDASGAQVIDGATTYVLNVNYQSVTIWNNGTKWLIE